MTEIIINGEELNEMRLSEEEIFQDSIEAAAEKEINATSDPDTKTLEAVPPSPLEREDPSELVSRLLHELQQLRREKRQLQNDLDRERLERTALQAGKSTLNAEIEELTRTLFEEANGMVAVEAQRSWALEQTQERLEAELAKTREQLTLEAQQTRLLRDIVEKDHDTRKCEDPVLWDVDVFGARLQGSYSDDFFPQRAFDSRHCAAAKHWELLGTRTVESLTFRRFSLFVDDCFRRSTRLASSDNTTLDDQIVLDTLSHDFIKTCIQGDIEPCLAFPVLERNGKTRSFLKRLLPAMLKNNCTIEPLPGNNSNCNSPSKSTSPSSIQSPESIRASPLSIRSFITLKTTARRSESPTPTSNPINITNNNALLFPADDSSSFSLFFGSSPSSITSIESCPVSPTASAAMLKCSMCEASGKDFASPSNIPVPTHRFRISSSDHWNLICKCCRDRLVSVASFLTLLRHLLQGLHAHRPKLDIFFDIMQAKRFMFYTRAGVDMDFFALSDFEAFSKKIH